MRRLGAEVRRWGRTSTRPARPPPHAAERGWRLLVDGEDPWIAIGAGTMALS